MNREVKFGQREYMRLLVRTIGRDREAVCAAYAEAEESGEVARRSNHHNKTSEEYALALWRDGEKKGWF